MRLLPLSALLAAAGTGSRTAATHTHALPVPTRAQLAWQKNEIMALIHFNMATFFQNGDPGCTKQNWAESQKPASFAPVKLNVSQWIDSMRALGVKEAVLTAKHGCGFLLWPTASRLPNASPYARAERTAAVQRGDGKGGPGTRVLLQSYQQFLP
jgi:alpha-L-fucosidase